MADNPLLKLLPAGKVRNAGKMIELKKQYDAAQIARQENGKPPLQPFEQWPPVIAYKASVGAK